MKTQGEKIEGGESKFSPTGRGEPAPLDTMDGSISVREVKFSFPRMNIISCRKHVVWMQTTLIIIANFNCTQNALKCILGAFENIPILYAHGFWVQFGGG